jgi:hypothetical protein
VVVGKKDDDVRLAGSLEVECGEQRENEGGERFHLGWGFHTVWSVRALVLLNTWVNHGLTRMNTDLNLGFPLTLNA